MVIFLLCISFFLIAAGTAGVVLRRNPLIMLMSIELMLNAANLMLVTVDRVRNSLEGQLFVLILMGIAAAEVAVGLALIVRIFRDKSIADVDEFHSLSG